MYISDTCVTRTVTITAGETVSTFLDKRYYRYVAILLPANWVTSTITFTGCDTENGTFIQLVSASDVSVVTVASVAASKLVTLDGKAIEAMVAVPFIKLVAGTAQATTDKIISITLKR